MKLVKSYTSRNILGWKEGTHTLELTFRGTKKELMQKLKDELQEDLVRHIDE